jgi:hypothetical protein
VVDKITSDPNLDNALKLSLIDILNRGWEITDDKTKENVHEIIDNNQDIQKTLREWLSS